MPSSSDKRGENHNTRPTPVKAAESAVEAANPLDFAGQKRVNPEDLTEGGPTMSTEGNHSSAVFETAPPPLRIIAPAIVEEELDEFATEHSFASADAPPGSRAVVYLRVSSKGQLNTDYDPEGISIPAQRVACTRKAEQLGLTVVGEYVEPGRSGTEMTKRVAFQQMLERIRRERDVDYVIVHKLSRFTRNRLDDAIVMADLQKRGVTLISATEQIDNTPEGQLMHGILATFNQYRSAADGADIAYKMGQKAKSGGTLGRAPIGYLNTLERIDGREIRSVAVDPERAPFVKLAFELYAAGKHTLDDIATELADRGLTSRPTAARPAAPIAVSKVQRMLRDRYYLGEIEYKGETYDGRHDPLIDPELFEQVQTLLDARNKSGERRIKNDHYLKGTIWCGRCRLEDRVIKRMIIMRATGRNGGEYAYFFCRGVQDHVCDAPYSNMERVERAIEVHYKSIRLGAEFIAAVRARLEEAVADKARAQQLLRQQLETQLRQLAVKEENLIDLAADGELSTARIKVKLHEITRARDKLTVQLGAVEQDLSGALAFIEAHLDLLADPYELYRQASDDTRRQLNQALFNRIYVVNDEVVGDELTSPLVELLAAERGWTALEAGQSLESATNTADAELARRSPVNAERATPKGDLFSGVSVGDLLPALKVQGDCSKPPMVREGGLEPPRPCGHWHLKPARLPIPPLARDGAYAPSTWRDYHSGRHPLAPPGSGGSAQKAPVSIPDSASGHARRLASVRPQAEGGRTWGFSIASSAA